MDARPSGGRGGEGRIGARGLCNRVGGGGVCHAVDERL